LLVAGPPYVLGGQANVRYLTGLQSSNAAVLVQPDGSATLFTDFRYASRAREIGGVGFVETARNLLPAIGELLSGRRISFEEAHLPHAGYRALVDAGANVNLPDRNGQTPLALAQARGHVAMVMLLRQAGAR